jgi:hypothetical protein
VEPTIVLAGAAAVLAALFVEQRLFAPGREPRRGEAIVWSIGWLTPASRGTRGGGRPAATTLPARAHSAVI